MNWTKTTTENLPKNVVLEGLWPKGDFEYSDPYGHTDGIKIAGWIRRDFFCVSWWPTSRETETGYFATLPVSLAFDEGSITMSREISAPAYWRPQQDVNVTNTESSVPEGKARTMELP